MIDRLPSIQQVLASLKFEWSGLQKRAGTLLIGTSPEFDLALYTLCFLSRRARSTCDVEIDGCPLTITSFDTRQNGRTFIGSTYPSAGRMTDACRQRVSRL